MLILLVILLSHYVRPLGVLVFLWEVFCKWGSMVVQDLLLFGLTLKNFLFSPWTLGILVLLVYAAQCVPWKVLDPLVTWIHDDILLRLHVSQERTRDQWRVWLWGPEVQDDYGYPTFEHRALGQISSLRLYGSWLEVFPNLVFFWLLPTWMLLRAFNFRHSLPAQWDAKPWVSWFLGLAQDYAVFLFILPALAWPGFWVLQYFWVRRRRWFSHHRFWLQVKLLSWAPWDDSLPPVN